MRKNSHYFPGGMLKWQECSSQCSLAIRVLSLFMHSAKMGQALFKEGVGVKWEINEIELQ
jgi:hypothetical protein